LSVIGCIARRLSGKLFVASVRLAFQRLAHELLELANRELASERDPRIARIGGCDAPDRKGRDRSE
jgi:hypothetical protein